MRRTCFRSSCVPRNRSSLRRERENPRRLRSVQRKLRRAQATLRAPRSPRRWRNVRGNLRRRRAPPRGRFRACCARRDSRSLPSVRFYGECGQKNPCLSRFWFRISCVPKNLRLPRRTRAYPRVPGKPRRKRRLTRVPGKPRWKRRLPRVPGKPCRKRRLPRVLGNPRRKRRLPRVPREPRRKRRPPSGRARGWCARRGFRRGQAFREQSSPCARRRFPARSAGRTRPRLPRARRCAPSTARRRERSAKAR